MKSGQLSFGFIISFNQKRKPKHFFSTLSTESKHFLFRFREEKYLRESIEILFLFGW
jgi:hypothetical protein